jgi:parallel beta-helix repeat protein
VVNSVGSCIQGNTSSQYINIEGNLLTSEQGYAIDLRGALYANIIKNKILKSGLSGIYLNNTSDSIINGNSIIDTGIYGSSQQAFIFLANNSNRNIITGNVINSTISAGTFSSYEASFDASSKGNIYSENIVEPTSSYLIPPAKDYTNNLNIIRVSLIIFGITALRPTNPTVGYKYFDTTLGKPVYWDGTQWVDSLPIASNSVLGSVKKSAALTSPVPVAAATDTPTKAEFDVVVAYLNELVSKQQAAGQQT